MSCKSRHLDAMQTVGNDVHILDWPYVDIGEDTVNPLRDVRVLEALKKVNMEHCCIKQWSFDFECETGCMPWHMVTNTMGQFLISQEVGKTVKVWDSNGMFQFSFNPQTDDPARRFYIWDIVTAEVDDKTYLLVDLPTTEAEKREVEVQVFNKTADVEYKFPVRDGSRLMISGSKLLVLKSREAFVYNQNGEFIRSFDIFDSKSNKCLNDCTATHDGRVLITHHVRDFRVYDCVHLFTVEGQQNATFKIFTPHTLF